MAAEVAAKLDAVGLSRTLYKNAVFIVESLLDKSWRDYAHDGWLHLNAAYLRRTFGSKYLTLVQALERAGVIEVNHSYCTGDSDDYSKAYPKAYRVARAAFDEGYAIRESRLFEDDRDTLSAERRAQVLAALGRLELDFDAALRACNAHADGLSLADYNVGQQIRDDVVRVREGVNSFYCSTAKALECAAERAKQLIQHKKRPGQAVLEEPTKFLNESRATARFEWTRAVTKIEAGIFRAKRNGTNSRLDHNLTSFPNKLGRYLRVDGEELRSIDLANSQFAFLAAIIRNPGAFKAQHADFFLRYTPDADTLRFCDFAERGELYAELGRLWGVDDKAGKAMAFSVSFSAAGNSTKTKRQFAERFPQLVLMTDAFKRAFGDNALSILLQQVEAEVFIDGAYYEVLDAGTWALSKHDSLIAKRSEANAIQQLVQKQLTAHNVAGLLRLEPLKD